jgi:hypothetical protein
MKNNTMLTVASLLSLLFLTLHFTDDRLSKKRYHGENICKTHAKPPTL